MPDAMASAQAVLTKMAMDQLFMSPLSTALFFAVMRCWEGHSNDALEYTRHKMVPTMKANYVLWPMAHIINFAFVPPAQRILYCNAVGVVWTVILSTILNAKPPPAAASAPMPSGGRGSGPAGGGRGSAGGNRGGSPGPGSSFGQPGMPRHVHAAFTASVAAPSANIFGNVSGGFDGDRQQPLKSRKGSVSSGDPTTRYGRFSKWEASSNDA